MNKPPDNRKLLRDLIEQNVIETRWGQIFDCQLPSTTEGFNFGKVDGMMLGLAIGDSLGATSESLPPHFREKLFGEIRNYLPNHYADENSVGLPTDDTQLSYWALEQMIEDGGLLPENVSRKFISSGHVFGIGSALSKALLNLSEGVPWQHAAPKTAGNGSLMRIAPVLIPHLKNPSPGIWVDAALLGMITHNDSAAISSCVAFTVILWELLNMNEPPKDEWWVGKYLEIAKDLEVDNSYRSRSPHYEWFQGHIWEFVQHVIPEAMEGDLSTRTACDRWYSAAYLLETVPSALYIMMRYAHNPEEAIVRAVNDTWDNDTTGAIVGAAMGALYGKDALPQRWLSGLLGRTSFDDDGRIFEIMKMARKKWG